MHNNRKVILFFLPLLTSGGAERVTINIIKELDLKFFDIHLVLGTKEGDAIHLIPKDIQVHNLNSPKTMYAILKLRKIIKKIQPNAIFSSLNRAHIALNLALIGFKQRPLTFFRIPSSPKSVNNYLKPGKTFQFLLNKALKNANHLIAQTPEMKEEILEFYPIKKEKIHVLINPLDTKLINASLVKKNLLFDNNYINVLASGRLSFEKGFDVLIEAFQRVHATNPKFRLYILGADYHNEQMTHKARIKELGLDNVIYFLGFQKNPYQYYQHADLFVLSSRWEGLPNAVLENIYLKKPIVATKCIPFMEQLIQNGKNGFLVEKENQEVLGNAILRYKELSEVGKETFKSANINNFFQRLVK